jgi:hypothetical protein
MIAITPLAIRSALFVGLLAVPGSNEGATRESFFQQTLARSAERAQAELLTQTTLWEDHSSWDDPWRIRTDHYEVVTTQSRLKGLEMAYGLETMLGHYQSVLGTRFVPPTVAPVLVHPSIPDYNDFGNGNNADEHSSFYPSFVAEAHADRPVATLATANLTLQLRWVTHGAVHRYLSDAEVSIPLWMTEGLASHFAYYWSFPTAVEELTLLQASDQWVDVDALITTNLVDFLDRPDQRLLELGMLFSYLMNYREGTRIERDAEGEISASPFLDYLRLMTNDRDVSQHPVHRLLTNGRGQTQLNRDFRAFDGWDMVGQ